MMRVLVLLSRAPALGKKGDQLVAYRRILSLISAQYKIHVICAPTSAPSRTEKKVIRYFESMGVKFEVLVIPRYMQVLNCLSTITKAHIPLQLAVYYSKKVHRRNQDIISEFKPHIILSILFRPLATLPESNAKLVVDFIDSISLSYSRHKNSHSFIRRIGYYYERPRVEKYEKKVTKRADLAFAVARKDAAQIDAKSIHVLPNGVDYDRFHGSTYPVSEKRVIFTGNMDYSPNIEAAKWFVFNCWHAVIDECPDAKFIISGSNPARSLKKLERNYKNVVVTGRVQSIAEELRRSQVAVAPMQSGAGMQNKILEAMASCLPIVSTNLGRGSISATAGEHLYVEDSPRQFSNCVVMLLKDKQLRMNVGENARRFVEAHHCWEEIGSSFIDKLNKLNGS